MGKNLIISACGVFMFWASIRQKFKSLYTSHSVKFLKIKTFLKVNEFFGALVFMVLGSNIIYGQTDTSWTRTYGGNGAEEGRALVQTTDGGYTICGWTAPYGAGSDVYLIKTNALGDTQWTRTYGGAGFDFGFSVDQTADGGYIIGGWTESFGSGGYDIYLIKTNATGDTQWTRTLGGPNNDVGHSVVQTTDGGYVVAGGTESFGAGLADVWLIKTDALGDTQWTKTYGGDSNDGGLSVIQTADGGYIVAGSTASFGAGNDDVYLIKTDALGDTQWTKTYGGDSTDVGFSVIQTADGGYLVVGATFSFGVGSDDVYLIKINQSGDIQWTKTYGGANSDIGYSVVQTVDDGYIIAGSTTSFGAGSYDVYLIKTNAQGDTQWTRTYGGTYTDEGFCIANTSDSGFAVVGNTSSFGSVYGDVWLLKLMPESAVEENSSNKVKLELLTNKPNLFRGTTEIRYVLPNSSRVRMTIYNIYGEKIVRIVDENKSAGLHISFWNGKDDRGKEVASGIYFCTLDTGNKKISRKFCLIR